MTNQLYTMDSPLAVTIEEGFQDWIFVPRPATSTNAPSVSDAPAEYGADSAHTLIPDTSFDDIIRAGNEEQFNSNTANNILLDDVRITLPEDSISQELELMATSVAVEATGGLFGFYNQEDITSFLKDLDAVLP